MGQEPYYEYTLRQSSQFKKDLKSVKFNEHKLDELQKILERLVRLGSYSKLFDKQRKCK